MIFKAVPKKTVEKAFEKGLFAVQEQIKDDCNRYVKVDQHTLERSAYTEVDGTTLAVIWNTPYARRQYYTGTPSKDVNPNASILWAEKAAAEYKDDWEAAIQKAMKNG